MVADRAIARGGAWGTGRGARGVGAVGEQPPSRGQPCAWDGMGFPFDLKDLDVGDWRLQ